MFFNEMTAAAQAKERVARFHKEAALRRFSRSRPSFPRVLFLIKAATVKLSSIKGGRYVRT